MADLMHFDIGGRRGRIERYSRESIGAELPPEAGTVAAGPEEPPINTLVKLDQSGLNVTHFGYMDDPNLDSDSAAGHGKYVENMIPGYDVALNAQAAAMVGNPKPGETFQFAGREWRYGDKVPEKYSDARFDIFDQSGTALTGAMPVGKSVAAAAAKDDDWTKLADSWVKLSPEDQAAVDKQIAGRQQDSLKTLQAIADQTPNKGDLWKKLNGDIPGVSKDVQQQFKDKFKQQVTDYALDYYKKSNPKITPDEAFKTATSDPDFGTYFGEVWSKILPEFQHMGIAGARAQDVQEENTVNQFFKAVNPDSTAEQRVQLKRQFMAMDPQHRRQVLGQMLSGNGDAAVADRMSTIDAPTLFDAFDHVSDPVYQANRKAEISKAVAQNVKDLTTDPRIAGTPGAIATSLLSSMPKNMVQMGTGVYGESSMMQEIYFDTKDQLAKEHPDWDEDKLKDAASTSTAAQMGPQMIIMRLGGGALNALTKGITQPLYELGARLGIHSTAGGLMAGVQQVMKNITTNHPPMEGVQEAVITGAAQTGIAAGITGGIKGHGPEGEVKPEAVPPPLPEEKPVATPAAPAPPAEPPTRPVTRGEILGPDVPDKSVPWYAPDPVSLRHTGETGETFTPSQFQEALRGLPEGGTPGQMRQAAEDMRPGLNFRREVTFGEPQSATEVAHGQAAQGFARPGLEPFPTQAHAEVYQDLVSSGMRPARAHNFVSRALGTTPAEILSDVQTQMRRGVANPLPVDLPTAIRQAKTDALRAQAEASLSGRKPATAPSPPTHGNISGEDPWVSHEARKTTVNGVANRYIAERVKGGELEPINPEIGASTEELMARGMKMNAAQVDQHISDMMENAGGNMRDQAAAVRKKEQYLTQRSRALSLKAETTGNAQDRANYEQARKELNDFHAPGGPIKKMKELFHQSGVGLQGEPSIDLSTYGGLDEKYLKETGKPSPPKFRPRLEKVAKGVRDSSTAEYKARADLEREANKPSKRKIPDADKVVEDIHKAMNGFPCPM
jgi:hypothetical protein